MKRFASLFLLALLFTGCNNMLTNPDAFHVEDAHVSMDVSQLKARYAGDGNVITSTLDFVGEEPKHAPFEKTQTVTGGTIDYTIKGLPVGSTVQVKLSVFRNGLLFFEGVSNKVTIKGKSALNIVLNKQSNWIILPLNLKEGDGLVHYYKVDLNASAINESSVNEESEILDSYATSFCTDDKGNLYYFSSGTASILRYAPPYKESVTVMTISKEDNVDMMKYDAVTDALYIFYYNQSSYFAAPIPNASTVTNLSYTNLVPTVVSEHLYEETNGKFIVSNGYLYYIGGPSGANGAAIFRQPLNENTFDKTLTLFAYDSTAQEENKYYGEIIKPLKIYDGFNVGVSDLVATKEGIFVLIKDYTEYINGGDGYYNASRGGVVKIDYNLTSAKLYGWTNTKRVIDVTHKDGDTFNHSFYVSQYMPKNISAGFYGPYQIVAIKPKKLIFTDFGAWAYLYENGNLPKEVQKSQRLVIFDLEECTWTSQEIDLELDDHLFPSANYSEAIGSTYRCTETWQ